MYWDPCLPTHCSLVYQCTTALTTSLHACSSLRFLSSSSSGTALVTAGMAAMQAIEFVQMQRDDELWELLISLALESPVLTGQT